MCECHGPSEMIITNGCPVSQSVWHTKEPSLLNSHECRAKVKFFSPSSAMVTSTYEWKILEWDEKPQANKNGEWGSIFPPLSFCMVICLRLHLRSSPLNHHHHHLPSPLWKRCYVPLTLYIRTMRRYYNKKVRSTCLCMVFTHSTLHFVNLRLYELFIYMYVLYICPQHNMQNWLLLSQYWLLTHEWARIQSTCNTKRLKGYLYQAPTFIMKCANEVEKHKKTLYLLFSSLYGLCCFLLEHFVQTLPCFLL